VDWRKVPLQWSTSGASSEGCSTDNPLLATEDPKQLLNHPANIRCARRKQFLPSMQHVILGYCTEMCMFCRGCVECAAGGLPHETQNTVWLGFAG